MTDILSITQTFPTIDFVVVGGDTLELQLPSPAVFVLPEFDANPSGVNDVTAASEVSSPVVAQVHDLNASDVSAASTVDTPAPGQVFALVGDDVSSTSSISVPTARTGQSFGVNDVSAASEVAAVSVGQVHTIAADDLSSAAAVDTPTAGQVHALTADNISATSQVDTPTASEDSGLAANDLTSASEVSSPAPGQVHALTADDVSSVSSVDTPTAAEAGGGYASLQAMADDIFTGGRTGILIAPGEADYQETGSQTTAATADDVVGSIVSLDPATQVVASTADAARVTLRTESGNFYYEYTDGDEELRLIAGAPSGTYTLAFPIRMPLSAGNVIVLSDGSNSGRYLIIAQDGSSSTTISGGLTGSPTVEFDGASAANRGEIHDAITTGDWVYVFIEGFTPSDWDNLDIGAFHNSSFHEPYDLGPLMIVDDTLTAQEKTDVENAIMAAVTP